MRLNLLGYQSSEVKHYMHYESTYTPVVVPEGNFCISPLESIGWSMVPCNIINPVGFVVISTKTEES